MTRSGLVPAHLVLAIAGIGLAVAVLLAAIGVILVPRESRYNSQTFPIALRDWNPTWSCQRCGTWFLA